MSSSTRSARVTLLALIVATAFTSAAAGCTSGRHHARSRPALASDDSDAVTLVVRNGNFADVDVRVAANGMQARLGVVQANLTQTFALASWVARSPEVYITATPLGGTAKASTGAFSVQPGQTIEFNVGMRLWQSSVFIH